MIMREAAIEDLPRMEDTARQFYASSQYLREFDLKNFTALWKHLLSTGLGAIFVFEHGGEIVGGLGGHLFPDLYSNDLVAAELFWFVRPEHRGRGMELYHAFEDWAMSRKVSRIRMSYLCDLMPKGLKLLYEELGFHQVEVSYEKELLWRGQQRD